MYIIYIYLFIYLFIYYIWFDNGICVYGMVCMYMIYIFLNIYIFYKILYDDVKKGVSISVRSGKGGSCVVPRGRGPMLCSGRPPGPQESETSLSWKHPAP